MKISKKQTLKKYTETVIQMILHHYTPLFFSRTKISQFLQDLAQIVVTLIVQLILGAVHSVVWATKVSPDY